jgi:hypothetical protein
VVFRNDGRALGKCGGVDASADASEQIAFTVFVFPIAAINATKIPRIS